MEMEMQSYVAKYLEKFKNVTPDLKGQVIFRGQSNSEWKIVSSAARRIKDQLKDKDSKLSNSQSNFIGYHVNLITNARTYGYAEIQPGSKLSDLDILAEIQHLGGSTCLVDFTTNVLIALWMATEIKIKNIPRKDSNGKLIEKENGEIEYDKIPVNGKMFWIDLGEEFNLQNIVYYNTSKEGDTIQKILTKVNWNFELPQHKLEPCFWLWNPSKLNERIIMQDSVFLFGLAAFSNIAQNDSGNGDEKKVQKENARIRYNEIEIDSADKPKLREELETLFGISAETIYYDLQGYAYEANHYSKPISKKIISNRDCLLDAKENIKRENYSQAIKILNQALSCKSVDEAENCREDKRQNCVKDNLGEIYFWKGIALKSRGFVDEAFLNFHLSTMAFLKNENAETKNKFKEKDYSMLCEAYRKSSIILYQKKDYNGAEKIDKQLYELFKRYEDEYPKQNPNYQNGADAIMTLFELMIMQFKETDEINIGGEKIKIRETAEKICKEKTDNSEILWIFLEEFYKLIDETNRDSDITNAQINVIFNKINKVLDNIKNVLINNKNENIKSLCLINYFYWEYDDIIKWVEDIRDNSSCTKSEKEIFITNNADKLILLAQKANDAQNVILNMIFEESKTAAE